MTILELISEFKIKKLRKMNTISTLEQTTIVAFHIGRGGHFHNSGHRSFIGVEKIDHYTSDLFIAYENQYEIHREIKGRENLEKLYEVATDFSTLANDAKVKFERRTGLKFGELIYTDGGGNPVGLTVEQAQTGIGRINIDNDYDTTYTCKLADCDEEELKLIRDYSGWVPGEVMAWVEEYFSEETEEN